MSAKRPSSSPSTRYSSHSGFDAVEPLGDDARGQRAQLRLRARRGQRRVADVVLEVEGGVVDPQRPAGLQRREGELLPVARDEVQAAADVRGEVARRRAPGPRGSSARRCACATRRAPARGTTRPPRSAGPRAPEPSSASLRLDGLTVSGCAARARHRRLGAVGLPRLQPGAVGGARDASRPGPAAARSLILPATASRGWSAACSTAAARARRRAARRLPRPPRVRGRAGGLRGRVAMEYSPHDALPIVAFGRRRRGRAGPLARRRGRLAAPTCSRRSPPAWDDEAEASHHRAVEHVMELHALARAHARGSTERGARGADRRRDRAPRAGDGGRARASRSAPTAATRTTSRRTRDRRRRGPAGRHLGARGRAAHGVRRRHLDELHRARAAAAACVEVLGVVAAARDAAIAAARPGAPALRGSTAPPARRSRPPATGTACCTARATRSTAGPRVHGLGANLDDTRPTTTASSRPAPPSRSSRASTCRSSASAWSATSIEPATVTTPLQTELTLSTLKAMAALAPEKLLLAAPRGYCAGVDRAVQTVERALELLRAAGLRAQGDRPQQARRGGAARARRDLRRGARRRDPRGRRHRLLRPRRVAGRPRRRRARAACARSTRPARSSPRSTARRSSSPARATRSS